MEKSELEESGEEMESASESETRGQHGEMGGRDNTVVLRKSERGCLLDLLGVLMVAV